LDSHAYTRAHDQSAPYQRSPFALSTISLVLSAALSLAGCVGLTSAGTPAANSHAVSTEGKLAASAISFTFGGVKIGSQSIQTLTLSNTGNAPVMISQANITGAAFSVIGGMSSVPIAAGQQQTFQVQFAPTATGTVTGSIAVTSDATDSALAISLSGTGISDLAITTQPTSQSVISGQTATFSVGATGSGTLTYQWQKNGASIGGATAASYTTPATMTSDSGAQLSVLVTDSTGSLTSDVAILTVTAAAVAPSITTQPVNQTVTPGQTATFSVTATGTATLTYQWKKNGATISGATSSSYSTPATAASDNGAQFTVAITNSVGSITSNAATLTVNVPPSITAQPASQTVIAGQTATFSVRASGTAPLAYQWNMNGTAISGATSVSYATPATTTANSGTTFTVTVSNAAGNVTSNLATLTVNAATFLLDANPTSLNFVNVNVGSNAVLPVTFTNSGNSSVTVSNVSISGAGFTASSVSSGQMVTPGNTATLNVTFAPAAGGTVTGASVTVTSNATNSPAMISLSGTGVETVTHSVSLGWTASTSVVSGYNIYRSTVSGGPYTKLNAALILAGTYTDSTAQPGQTYYFVGTSLDSSGVESADSNEISATVP
jgi:hypothetical protein